MAASKKDIDDLSFILEENKRLANLLKKSLSAYQDDFSSIHDSLFSTINKPRDVRIKKDRQLQILLSSNAKLKIQEIASRQIESHNLSFKVTASEYIIHIKDSIYIHLMNNKSFDQAGCSSLLSMAYKRSAKKMVKTKYFFPLQADGVTTEKNINIGSVKIIDKDEIYSKITERSILEKCLAAQRGLNYNSFLYITIPKSSIEMSKIRAESVADFIFGIIKVFATLYQIDADHLSLMKNPIENDTKHYITCVDSKYNICESIFFGDELKEFWAVLEDEINNNNLGKVIKELTNHVLDPSREKYLFDRLIDSFCWFGDASRDNNSHSQVVKLSTAMERLVTLSKDKRKEGLTQRFVNRVSCIIANNHGDGDIEKWKSEASSLYSLRSSLVHGEESLYKSYSTSLNFSPFKLACLSILSSCVEFNKLGLDLTKYEYKLEDMYRDLSEKFVGLETSSSE